MSVWFYSGSPGKLDSRALNRETLSRWTGRISDGPWVDPGSPGNVLTACLVCSSRAQPRQVALQRPLRFEGSPGCATIARHIRAGCLGIRCASDPSQRESTRVPNLLLWSQTHCRRAIHPWQTLAMTRRRWWHVERDPRSQGARDGRVKS